MGNLVRVEGGMTISPDITWKEIQAAGYDDGFPEGKWTSAKLVIRIEQEETDEGTLIRRTGTGIMPSEEGLFRATLIVKSVQRIVDAFPGHEFSGYFECNEEYSEDLWRVYVKNRQAFEVRPEIVWPEDPQPEG